MLLPGKVGFAEDNSWRFNQLPAADAGAVFHPLWRAVDHAARNQSTFIAGNRPKGFSPDWVRYEKDKGWQLKAEKH